MISQLIRFLELINTPGALLALISWPKFSLASYKIISRAKLAGVVPKTVIDVGANVGQFTVASDKLFKKVNIFPIEPDPRTAIKLKKNAGSRLEENIRVTAIGDIIESGILRVNSDSQVSSLLPLGIDRIESFPASKVIEEICIPITTLDALFNGIHLERPILLKIDAQGYEDRIILGASKTLKNIQWVLIEVSFSKLYDGERDFETIVTLLKKHGFRFIKPLNFHVSPNTGEIIEMDALFELESKD
ncbi:FkbM family methyltransferase [Polynucleobacter sp. JS-JIR-II-b4]|uniref:FkbM family methyltransferase n=1 Tax=Polynucleobacter sp. JS-JIR-II-b4 TaxID=1758390 RepID=UPI001BFEAD50|nr:FkbM family methyltransferase [Polynucleobacter sp. JS-JIR-II-b4]QWE02851.1 FkbM family methyltransferase [Polynucleobacter sp. JS-JIR-II-b4]